VGKNKLKRFEEIKTFEKVFQPAIDFHSTDHELKGKWNEKVFFNDHPIVLDWAAAGANILLAWLRNIVGKILLVWI
jgi:hypothetical protein